MSAERLGRAVLELDTDDSRLGRGIAAARRAAQGLQDKFNDSASKLRASMMAAGKSMQGFGTRASEVGRDMSLAFTLPLAGVLKFAGDFEKGMNKVAALSGATADQLGKLRAQARELGAKTKFSASQAADAMGFLAMAGFKANEILGAMPGTLQLAASANLDLGQTADIVSNILTGYGLKVSELGRANDVLTKAFTSANTNLAQLGEAMKYAGPIAKAAGVSFEETAAAISLMGNAGIQGTMAGTSLRGAISHLLNPTKEAGKALAEAGIKVTDTNGRLLPLVDIVKQLEKKADDAGFMMTVFGQRAGPAMAALAGMGGEALAKLTGELQNSGGTAERIADVQMRGFNGAMLELKSAAEGLAIAIGESGLLQSFTGFVKQITELVRWFSSLPAPMQEFGAKALAILGVGGPVVLSAGLTAKAIGGVITTLASLGPVIATVGRAILGLVAAAGPIGLLIAAAGLLTAAYLKWGDDWKLAMTDLFEWIAKTFDKIKNLVFGVFGAIGDKISGVWDSVTAGAKKMYDTLVGHSIIPDMVTGIEGWLDRLVGSAGRSMGSVNGTIDRSAASAGVAGRALQDFGSRAGSAFAQAAARGEKLSDVLRGLVQDTLGSLRQKVITDPLQKILGGAIGSIFGGGGAMTEAQALAAGIAPLATGTDYVPHDGLAYLHQGEKVVPASQNVGGQVTVQMVNNGTPQRVVSAGQRFDGKGMIVSIITEDVRRGGPIGNALESAFGLNRASA